VRALPCRTLAIGHPPPDDSGTMMHHYIPGLHT
jgi:hypothetical protein